MATFQRIPPLPANLGQACYKCFSEHSAAKPISSCSACKRIGYCSKTCQKSDWAAHKRICKGHRELEESGSAMSLHFYNLSDPTAGDTINATELAELTNMCLHADVHSFEGILGRPLSIPERNLFAWEPRCAACGITERMLRIRANEQGTGSATQLQKCMDCRTTFFCSPRHFALVKKNHNTVPYAVGYDNMTQCQINRQIREDDRLANLLFDAQSSLGDPAEQGSGLKWAPERTLEKWQSVSGTTWEGEFLDDLMKSHPLPEGTPMSPFLRATSDSLTLPMTILYALEQLAGGTLDFTDKDVITIHVIGASGPEIQNSMVFEEILHRLSKVKRLEVLLCGPEMSLIKQTGRPGVAMNMATCPECQANDRNRIQILSSKLYHDFVHENGNKFTVPDLAVAFNSGSSEVETESWKQTMKVLIDRKIPSIFTSYNRGEAEQEAALLTELGAQLLPSLGPCRNPWGSMLLKIEPGFGRADGFYNSNGWFAGGFKGASE